MKESLYHFVSENWGKVLGGLIGLIVALTIALFGFWTGIFIILCVLVGVYLGARIEKQESLQRLVYRFWNRRDPY